ncbi:MAG: type II secretion system F family protein [Deltaproteobacteria bacterium]|nr:type II secretion system F family protein [Deltaproteobacteria bacterium]
MLLTDPLVMAVAAFVAVLGLMLVLRAALSPKTTLATDAPADDLFVTESGAGRLTTAVGSLANPRSAEERGALRLSLIQAGFEGKRAVELYSAARVLLVLGLPLLTWLALPTYSLLLSASLALITAAVGYYGPTLYLANLKLRRREALLKPFPNALDLLVTSVEAGLGLNAALKTVADELEPAAPLLAVELQRANHEITAGVPRQDALRRLDHRTGLTEMTSLVNVLIQAERYGTSVGRALRAHAELTRHKRMLAAEERAAKVAPKLTIVTVLLIMPSLFIVLLGPTIVNIVNRVIPMLQGGVL